MREEASTRAVSLGRVRVFAQDRAHEYSAETYTESVYVTSVQDRSRVSPAFGAKPGERECVCVGELFFGEGGESAEFAQDRGGKSRLVLLELDVYIICIRHVPPKNMSAVARGLVPRSAPNRERGGELLLLL